MIFWLQNPQTCVLCGRWILVKPMVLYYTWDSVSRPLASMYMANDSRVFVFFNLHRAHMAQDHAHLGVLTFRVYVQGKGFTSCFFFIMYKFLHYAYVTGSCKPTICVNNMDRAVDLRVRLVIPSNYPQGTVFLSSAPVFLSYCQGFTSGVIMHRAVTMHVAQDHANLCDHVC